jgi:murein DD-endopeptidase MepM/ murein hydrolase activator NlpD
MRIALSFLAFQLVASAAAPPPLPEIGYPLRDIGTRELRSQFNDKRRGHIHHAIDLMRRRGTPILAVADGTVRKLCRSRSGGISAYLFDASEQYCFFYGHLDHYAKGLHEGREVHRGDVIGYVGSTGNAKRSAPHLHFAVSRTGPERKWFGGVPIDPFPILLATTQRKGGPVLDAAAIAGAEDLDADDINEEAATPVATLKIPLN